MELEIINKIYLELSQFATAKTTKQLALERENERLSDLVRRSDKEIFKLQGAVAELRDHLSPKLTPTSLSCQNFTEEQICQKTGDGSCCDCERG